MTAGIQLTWKMFVDMCDGDTFVRLHQKIICTVSDFNYYENIIYWIQARCRYY